MNDKDQKQGAGVMQDDTVGVNQMTGKHTIELEIDPALIEGYRVVGYRKRERDEPYLTDGEIVTRSAWLGLALILEKLPPVMDPKTAAMLQGWPAGIWIAWDNSGVPYWFESKPTVLKDDGHWTTTGNYSGLPRSFKLPDGWTWDNSAVQLPEFEGLEFWENRQDAKPAAFPHPTLEAALEMREGTTGYTTFHVRDVEVNDA